ncbi:hypothetical protein [Mobilicoccus massiliensis]|uniref:hypothetical protein n=1 Tax=Mobilicoccus massiliensis TaxID=1522310 RepID=UPI00058BB371|nr:hypothetical protein [Mobilicoccus massiliensis]
MTRAGDPASCAVLAADLRSGAHRLRESTANAPTPGLPETAPTAGTRADVAELARALDVLGDALAEFAAALRDARPTRSGRPHPHTALRAACRRVCEELGNDQIPR